jgi:hypothetical protein
MDFTRKALSRMVALFTKRSYFHFGTVCANAFLELNRSKIVAELFTLEINQAENIQSAFKSAI